jgi:hypothetical protein
VSREKVVVSNLLLANERQQAELAGRCKTWDRDLVLRQISVLDAEVVILELQLHERVHQLLLDIGPDDARHLVTVHLYHRVGHLDLAWRSERQQRA